AEEYPLFFGINRMGAMAPDCDGVMRNVDGALPDEQRRGDCNECGWNCATPAPGCPPDLNACKFSWPYDPVLGIDHPLKTNYAYTALQGVLSQAVIHYRRGRDPWTIPLDATGQPTNAIRRAYVW